VTFAPSPSSSHPIRVLTQRPAEHFGLCVTDLPELLASPFNVASTQQELSAH
jgi:hypothetical protein